MAQNLQDALRNRRSHYSLSPASPISDEAIKDIIDFAVTHVPSAFNSQSTRIVLLLGENHRRLWDITKDTLRPLVPAKAFPATEAKIDGSFRNGHHPVFRRPRHSGAASGSLSALCRPFPHMGATHLSHAPTGHLGHAGGCRTGRIATTLQPTH